MKVWQHVLEYVMSLCIALIRFKWAIKRGTARILQLEGELKKAELAYLYLGICS